MAVMSNEQQAMLRPAILSLRSIGIGFYLDYHDIFCVNAWHSLVVVPFGLIATLVCICYYDIVVHGTVSAGRSVPKSGVSTSPVHYFICTIVETTDVSAPCAGM